MTCVMPAPGRRRAAMAVATMLLAGPSTAAAQLARAESPAGRVESPAGRVESPAGRAALTLAAAVDAALAAHPSLEAARAQRSGAEAGVGVARAARLPWVSVDGSASRFQEPMPIAPIHGLDPRRLPVFDRTLYRGDLRRLFAAGRTARIAGLRAEAAIGRAAAERAATASAVEVAERALARMMGEEPDAVRGRRLEAVRLAAPATTPDRAALIARAAANPELSRARGAVRAADAGVAEARAAWLPDVGLAGGYTRYGGGAGDRRGEWRGGLRVSVPVFTGGARIEAARRAGARAELRAAELRVADAVDRAVAALVGGRARAEAFAAVVEQAAEVARIERLALDNGAGVQTDYLAAEAELLHARAGLAEARHAVIGARIELARVTGELSREWLAVKLESGS